MMNVTPETFPSFIALCFDAGAAVYVEGPPGVGKSQLLEEYAKAQGPDYGYFVIDFSMANVADLMGYLMPKEEKHVGADGEIIEINAGRFTYPFFLRDKFTGKPAFMFKRGVVVFEEYGQGDVDLKKASAPMIHERRIGEWSFAGFDVALLSNRPQDRSAVSRDLDFVINRRTNVSLVPSLASFLAYGAERGLTPITLAFAARAGDKLNLFDAQVPEKQGAYLTPRSLEKLDKIIKSALAKGMNLDDELVLIAAAGTIGTPAAHAYMAFAKARAKIPTVSAIVADPDNAPIPSELDVTMFLVFDLASKVNAGNFTAIASYIKRLPSDMAVTFFHAATKRDKTLVNTREFQAFSIANAALLSAVVMRQGS